MRTVSVPCHAESSDCVPIYASPSAAGADLRAHIASELVIGPGKRSLVPTGVRLAIPEGYEGQVRPRSGLALRAGVTLLNSPGTIDADYRGEIQVLLVNLGEEPFAILPNDRIAQLVVAPVVRADFVLEPDLPPTKRGERGFGSTGR